MSGKDDSTCSVCGRDVAPLPYICTYCGRTFCAEHRLPEIHNCEKLSLVQETYRPPTSEDMSEEINEFEKADVGSLPEVYLES
jgi:predicted nucleic acid binding AN1-type Zn finger protein